MVRVKAFTIIEMIMSLLITSVVISIVFYVYLFFNKQFHQYQARSAEVNAYHFFHKTFQGDLDYADRVDYRSVQFINCHHHTTGLDIRYELLDSMILRRHPAAVDTFRFRNVLVLPAEEEAAEALPPTTFVLRLMVAGEPVEAVFTKRYSAHQLMTQTKMNE